LPNFEIVAKLISSGEHREPFIGRTLGPLRVRSGRRDAVVRRSREKYASRKGVVEAKINRWMKRTAA
jgi:hypothetical protein